MKGMTFGCELELSDWPRHEPLPVRGMGIDVRDTTMVNSNGVAVDPTGRLWAWGGEIQTAPTETPEGQAAQLADIMREWPETVVNYRSNLHVHVRVPGLRENLALLKQLQSYAHRTLPSVLPLIEPIPEPEPWWTGDKREGAIKRRNRRRVSHQKLLTPERLSFQLLATSPEDFRDREYVHVATGKLHPAIHPRLCFNLRQLWETDTIEFRHFPGTTEPKRLESAVRWCRRFLECALDDDEKQIMVHAANETSHRWLPRFEKYDHWLETGYQLTSRATQKAADIPGNIERWLRECKRS